MADGFLSNLGSAFSNFSQGATNLLANPLVNAAAATYLGAIGTPRWEGLGGAISRGGLSGLGALNQAQMAQYQLPILQAQAQQAQAQMAPIDPEDIKGFDQMIAKAVDPEEAQFYAMLKRGYQERKLSMGEAITGIRQYNEPKRMGDWIKAQAAIQGAANTAALLKSQGIQTPTVSMPGMPAQPPPASTAASGTPGLPTVGQYVSVDIQGIGPRQVTQSQNGQYYYWDNNTWHPLAQSGTASR